MNKHGGKRTGAGRPRGSPNKKSKAQRVEEALARKFLHQKILAEWEPLIDILLCTALGRKLPPRAKNDPAPSPEYCERMIDRIVPKPKPPLDVSASAASPELIQLAADVRAILTPKKEK